jgi:hypothetical protein
MLDKCSKNWRLGFTFEKCKIIHLGTNNKKHSYYLKNSGFLQETSVPSIEKDFVGYISDNLERHKQARASGCKANKMLSVLNNTFT